MSKTEMVQAEMVKAMKAKDGDRKATLSLLLSALKLAAKEKREPLTEDEENAIILKEIKQTTETKDSMPDNTDVQKESADRLAVLQEFAPAQMDETEINAAIDKVLSELSIEKPEGKDKGNIMKNLMPLVKGKADGGLVNKLVGQRMN